MGYSQRAEVARGARGAVDRRSINFVNSIRGRKFKFLYFNMLRYKISVNTKQGPCPILNSHRSRGPESPAARKAKPGRTPLGHSPRSPKASMVGVS